MRIGTRVRVKILVLLVHKSPRRRPAARLAGDLLGVDAKPLGHLSPHQEFLRTQSLETTLQSIFNPHAIDHATGKWFAIAGRRAARIQDVCDGPGGVVIQKSIDLRNHRSWSYRQSTWASQLKCSGGSCQEHEYGSAAVHA